MEHLHLLLAAINDPQARHKPPHIVAELAAGGERMRAFKPVASGSLPVLASALAKWKQYMGFFKRVIEAANAERVSTVEADIRAGAAAGRSSLSRRQAANVVVRDQQADIVLSKGEGATQGITEERLWNLLEGNTSASVSWQPFESRFWRRDVGRSRNPISTTESLDLVVAGRAVRTIAIVRRNEHAAKTLRTAEMEQRRSVVWGEGVALEERRAAQRAKREGLPSIWDNPQQRIPPAALDASLLQARRAGAAVTAAAAAAAAAKEARQVQVVEAVVVATDGGAAAAAAPAPPGAAGVPESDPSAAQIAAAVAYSNEATGSMFRQVVQADMRACVRHAACVMCVCVALLRAHV